MNRGLLDGLTVEDLIPVGTIWDFGGDEAPPGWLICDGSQVSRAEYARLFRVIGTKFGTGNGNTTFNLPPPGRVTVGRDSAQTEFDVVGETGGSKTSTAPHTHALATHDHHMNGHVHSMQGHVHSGAAHWHGLENHTHYVSTGGMSVNWDHTHVNQNGVVAFFSDDVHNHAGGGGQLSESGGAVGGTFFGTNMTTTATNVNHVHGAETGWFNSPQGAAGATYTGNSGGNSDNTGGNSNATSGAQNIGTAQASSAGATSGNLPPYVVVNKIIKW